MSYLKADFETNFPTFDAFEAVIREGVEYPEREFSWTTGGQSGGSCWDEGPHSYYAIEAEEEPELETLDEILELVVPDLTFLQYRKLMKIENVVAIRNDGYSDYYGNYTSGKAKKVDLYNLYEALLKVLGE